MSMSGDAVATRRRARGFTLIELMLATAIFISGVAAILGLHLNATQIIARARNYDRATSLLLDAGELLQVLTPEQLQLVAAAWANQGYSATGELVPVAGGQVFYTMAASTLQVNGSLGHLTITISWQDPGVATTRTITSDALVAASAT